MHKQSKQAYRQNKRRDKLTVSQSSERVDEQYAQAMERQKMTDHKEILYMTKYPLNNEQTAKAVKADELLSEGLQILTQRGEQYGSEQRECSFPQAAEAFNAITGHNLKGSDICLILALLKQVRQYAQPRYHHDSVVDGVNYLALHGQELAKERK